MCKEVDAAFSVRYCASESPFLQCPDWMSCPFVWFWFCVGSLVEMHKEPRHRHDSSDGWNANRNIESRSLGVLYCSDAARDVSLLNYCQQFFYCYYNWRCISQDTNRTSFWPLLAAFLSDFTVEKHSWPQFCLNVGFWNQSDDLYLEVFHSSSFHPQNRTTNSWTTKCSSPTWFCSVKRNQSESEEGPSAVTLKKR